MKNLFSRIPGSLLIIFVLTGILRAQLTGGVIYPINGIENPPSSFENIYSAVSYLTANGVTGSGEVILELNSGITAEPGPVTIGPVNGTETNLGVTFRPAPGYTANTFIVGGGAPEQHGISFAGCSYVTLDGRSGGTGSSRDWTIRVAGSGTTGNGQMAVRVDGTGGSMTGINVRYLTLIGEAANVTNGVFTISGNSANTVSNIIVEHNMIRSMATSSSNTRAYGIAIHSPLNNAGNTGIRIRNNDVTNVYGRGISITAACPGMEIHNNSIYHTTAITQPVTTEFAGIYFSSALTNANGNKIYNNRIYDIRLTNGITAINGFYSIGTPGSGERLAIYNNMISIGDGLTGTAANISVYGIREFSTSTSRFDIFYNSVYIGGMVTRDSSILSAAFRKQTSNNIDARNNLFINARTNSGGTGAHYAVMINNMNATSRNYNDYYVSGTGGVLGTTTGTAAGNQNTLADWKTATGRDTNSISGNVFFSDPSAGNLHLTASSVGDTNLKGIPVSWITTDIDGNPRNALAPYMGADEGETPLSVSAGNMLVPDNFLLHQNYPNPFNPDTKINYELPYDARISIKVFDITGREVVTIIDNEFHKAGQYSVVFDTRQAEGGLASGTYFYSLIADNGGSRSSPGIITKMMVVVK